MRVLVFLLLVPCFCFGQNLVPNPSFEDIIKCPQTISSGTCGFGWYDAFTDCVPPWYLPTCGTSDYYNACNNTLNGSVGVPYNVLGYQEAHTGVAYAGMITYANTGNPADEWREYIETPLTQPLQAGRTYIAEFYVNLSNIRYCAIDSIGLYFSIGPIDTLGVNWKSFSFPPHISSPAGNFLNDTVNWTEISGTYVATGGEDHITIGNFSNKANTANNSVTFYSYYYIDDVSVIEDTIIGIEENKITTIIIHPNPTTGKFTVQGATGEIQVYDLFGRLVLRTNKNQIDMRGFASGMYYVKVGEAVKKLVIQ